jgi:hypothetical protein
VEPELALGLPAVGAVAAGVLKSRRRVAFIAAAGLGLAGIAAVLAGGPPRLLWDAGLGIGMSAPGRAILVASALALALIVSLAPPRVDRLALLSSGLAGLAALAAFLIAPNLILVAVAVLVLGVAHASLPALRTFAERLRGPALAAVLLAVGVIVGTAEGPLSSDRVAAVALVLGLVSGVGLLPYLQRFEPGEPAATSPIAWTAFFGPALAVVVVARAIPLLAPQGVPIYGALMIGFGLINLYWGVLGSWRAETEAGAWRYSFLADWGLAMVGFGILVPDGVMAAYLVLLSMIMVRMPLYLWARPVVLGREQASLRGLNLLIAAALVGTAPFAGFAYRVMLLRGATELFWPLALVLVPAMLLWLPSSIRLARSIGRPRGRTAIGVAITLGVSLAIGVYPGLFQAAFTP